LFWRLASGEYQPSIWRSMKPAGLPSFAQAERLVVDGMERGQRVDQRLAHAARRVGLPAKASGIVRRTTTPCRRSITKNGAPITDSSSQNRKARGA
jgi:hypothetical protein